MTPETCPNCGADVPARARACPECGSDESTGWSEEAAVEGLGLPQAGFDYNDFVQREFHGPPPSRSIMHRVWWVAGILLLVALLLLWFAK
jgi:hypothetical protein